jgi:hypothetical protein
MLLAITVLVLLAHAALLSGLPLLSTGSAQPQGEVTRVFTTRTIRLDSAPGASPVAPVTKAPPISRQLRAAKSKPVPKTQVADAVPKAAEQLEPKAASVDAAPVAEAPAAEPAVDAAATTPAGANQRYTIPGSTRLKYDVNGEVKGFRYFVNGELLWLHDGATYDARLEISHFLLGSRVQTSKGKIGPDGLEPTRFGDKVRSEVAAHFERSKNKVSFSANTPDAPLLPGAQDQLSVFIQLAAMMGGDADRFTKGASVSFQAVGPRSSETWNFLVGASELLKLPGGDVKAVKFTREPVAEFDPKVEVWLAPEMDYIPVRIRLSQSNGDFVEQQWSSTQKP